MYLSRLVAVLGVATPFVYTSPCSLLPQVTLPYGTWSAAKHEPIADVYAFRNIRYAAPPTGPRRWTRPSPPEPVSGLQDGSYGPICIQTLSNNTDDNVVMSEDCLFLDVYVPRAGITGQAKNIPVIVWVYGGSYTSGAKDVGLETGHFDGTGLICQAEGDAVVVIMNYRLGPLGFIGGTSAEEEQASNLGLHDQRAALQWVRDYISLFGGDPNNVSLWGSSAGSGSIIHHITQKGGRRDPLFNKAVIQSPGYATIWDRNEPEEVVQIISEKLGCGKGPDFDCMRAADESDLISLWGLFSPSPVPDGDFVERPAILELQDGRYWKGLDSIISSHASNEGFPWGLSGTIKTEKDFDNFVVGTFGNRTSLPSEFRARYSHTSPADRYTAILNDVVFMCHNRYAVDAFPEKSYAGVYAVGLGLHSADTYATWYNPTLGLDNPTLIGSPELNDAYQAYLVSHARSGDVNTYRNRETSIDWPKVSDASADKINALESNNEGFQVITSDHAKRSDCDFLAEIWRYLWEDDVQAV